MIYSMLFRRSAVCLFVCLFVRSDRVGSIDWCFVLRSTPYYGVLFFCRFAVLFFSALFPEIRVYFDEVQQHFVFVHCCICSSSSGRMNEQSTTDWRRRLRLRCLARGPDRRTHARGLVRWIYYSLFALGVLRKSIDFILVLGAVFVGRFCAFSCNATTYHIMALSFAAWVGWSFRSNRFRRCVCMCV